jgi:hypothetical protein
MVENYDERAGGDDEGFAERIARSLRGPEFTDPSLEARIMRQVRAEAPNLYPIVKDSTLVKADRVIEIPRPLGLADQRSDSPEAATILAASEQQSKSNRTDKLSIQD